MTWAAETVAATYRATGRAQSVSFADRSGAVVTMTDCAVSRRVLRGPNQAGAMVSTPVVEVVIPQTGGNVKPQKDWTGNDGAGTFPVREVSDPGGGYWQVTS